MLALTDAALARLYIGATRVDPRRRRQWLRDIAARLTAPSSENGSHFLRSDPLVQTMNPMRSRHPSGRSDTGSLSDTARPADPEPAR
jgi:hypothetical protein